MPPCLLRSPPAPVGLGRSAPPPQVLPPPPQLFQVTVITNHDNHSDPWRRLITVVLSLVQTPQCLLCPVWRGGLGTPALILTGLRKSPQNVPTRAGCLWTLVDDNKHKQLRTQINSSWLLLVIISHGVTVEDQDVGLVLERERWPILIMFGCQSLSKTPVELTYFSGIGRLHKLKVLVWLIEY